jgi:hypothetical protein
MNAEIEQLLEKVHLNWSVRTEPVQTTSGITIPDYKAIVREDTNVPLKIMGKDYGVLQNSELMELLYGVSNKSGLSIHKGGSFDNGSKVFMQIKSGDLKLGNDKIEGFITGINSFDGSTSLAFGPSNRTMSCSNMFYSMFRSLDSRIRHTKNIKLKIDDVMVGLETSLKEEKDMFANIKRLSETKMDDNIKEKVTRVLFNVRPDTNLNETDKLSTQAKNKLSSFYVDLNGELQSKGSNLWGLFSGITRYTTHSLGKGQNDKQKMFGIIGNRERQIFNELVELV